MLNFSALSTDSVLGRLLRVPLRLIPPGTVVPILQGELRGERWVVGSCDHGCWLGSYECCKQGPFARSIRPGDVVFDLGANVGFYSLLAARRAGPGGTVVAFEPLPRNLSYLQRHIRLNRLDNVKVIDAVVSDDDGVARFAEGASHGMGRVDPAGAREVRSVRLDTLVASGEIPAPDVIKMDIEGAEHLALQGAGAVLTQHRPTIFLATHNREVDAACRRLLAELGYRLESLGEGGGDGPGEYLASHPDRVP